ncbi:hypothetical protein, partial [Dysosmobacter sp. HCP28S3_G4]|uniref:hypothetical protein n=1 Tax=Dysosmobacter sp. HCP28S3_G4 TaxID=3438938 RepID=UPI003F8B8578
VGDLPIRDGYVYVSVKKAVPATKDVTVVFYEDVATNEIGRTTIKVDADATYVNTSKLTAPDGYKMVLVGDLTIDENGYVFVKVEKIVTEKTVKINFYDETEEKQVAEVEM